MIIILLFRLVPITENIHYFATKKKTHILNNLIKYLHMYNM